MAFPSVKTLSRGMPVEQARRIRRKYESLRNTQISDRQLVDRTLEEADQMMNGSGVEAIHAEKWPGPRYFSDRNYYYDIAMLYVNLGDTYATTLYYDVSSDNFRVGSWGDFVEAKERQGWRFD